MALGAHSHSITPVGLTQRPCRYTITVDKKDKKTKLPSQDSILPVDSVTLDGYVFSKGLHNATFQFRNPQDDELDTANFVKWERHQKQPCTTAKGEEKTKDDFVEVRTPFSGACMAWRMA